MYKERIANLLNAIDLRYPRGTKQRDQAIDTVEIALELFPRCAAGTYSKNITLDMAKLQVDETTYDGMKKNLRDSRQSLCDATLNAIQNMNWLAIELGVNQIYDENMDRDSIEMFCSAVVKEYFDNRSC